MLISDADAVWVRDPRRTLLFDPSLLRCLLLGELLLEAFLLGGGFGLGGGLGCLTLSRMPSPLPETWAHAVDACKGDRFAPLSPEVTAVADQSDGSRLLTFRLPDELAGEVVEKGSVTLDGTSLTVASAEPFPGAGTFEVALIPHTLEVTTFGRRSPGDRINVEADVIARYVAGLLAAGRIQSPGGEPSQQKGDG